MVIAAATAKLWDFPAHGTAETAIYPPDQSASGR